MTTAAIREKLAARGITSEPPYGCRWCGDEQHHHGSQWAPIVGMHQWMEPDQALILERMRRRRANRLSAEPTLYHATTEWAADLSGESADPYCADCKTDGCRQWMRTQTRLDNRRMELDGINPKRRSKNKGGGWGGSAPW
jgi:hypothetical protein